MTSTKKRSPSHDVVAALLVEHRHAARLLDVLEQQLDLAARDRAIDRDAVRSVMHYMTEYPDAYHHPREDALFVRLARREPRLRKRIAAIEREHRTIGRAGKELLEAAGPRPGAGADESRLAVRLRDYLDAQRAHMTIEERDLFPRVAESLDDEDLAAIERDFRRVTDPIFEASVRDAYSEYPTLVRMLVEAPAARQLLDAFDSFFDSASTLGELLFGRTTKPAAAVDTRHEEARRRERRAVGKES